MSQVSPAATQPSQPQYPLTDLAIFPIYPTQAAAASAGMPVVWDASKPVQRWIDDGLLAAPYAGPGALAGNGPAATVIYLSNKNSQTDYIAIPVAQASLLNIPPDGYTGAVVNGADYPRRPLLSNETLTRPASIGMLFPQSGTPPIVYRTDLVQPGAAPTLADVYARLEAIAQKLGV